MTKDDPTTQRLIDKFFDMVHNRESDEQLRRDLSGEDPKEIEMFLNHQDWSDDRALETLIRRELNYLRWAERNVTVSPVAASASAQAGGPTVTVSPASSQHDHRAGSPRVFVSTSGARAQPAGVSEQDIEEKIDAALELLREVRDAIGESKDDPLWAKLAEDSNSLPGIGHNRPPRDSDDLLEITEESISTLETQEIRLGVLRAIGAAFAYYAKRIADGASTSFGATLGTGTAVYLLSKVSEAAAAVLDIVARAAGLF